MVNRETPPSTPSLDLVRVVTLLGLTLVFPCPWYMIAVGGLLPLPVFGASGVSHAVMLVRTVSGVGGGVVLVIALLHIVLYGWLFYRLTRWAGAQVRTGRVHAPAAIILLLLMFLGLGVLPIYGGGENLLGGGGSYRTAYTLYRETIGPMVAAWRP